MTASFFVLWFGVRGPEGGFSLGVPLALPPPLTPGTVRCAKGRVWTCWWRLQPVVERCCCLLLCVVSPRRAAPPPLVLACAHYQKVRVVVGLLVAPPCAPALACHVCMNHLRTSCLAAQWCSCLPGRCSPWTFVSAPRVAAWVSLRACAAPLDRPFIATRWWSADIAASCIQLGA